MYSAPGNPSTSNMRWWRVTSVVKPADLATSRPSEVVMWQMLILDPENLEASLPMALVSADSGRLRRWSRVHPASSLDIIESSSAWTLMRFPVPSTRATAGTRSASSLSRMSPVVEPMKSLNPGTRGAKGRGSHPAVTAANRP